MGSLAIRDNSRLESLALPALVNVESYALFHSGDTASSIQAPNLTYVGAVLRVTRAPDVESVSFPSLRVAAGGLFVQSMHGLRDFDAPDAFIVGDVLLSFDAALESFSLPKLLDIAGRVEMLAVGLSDLSGFSPRSIEGDLRISGSQSLTDITAFDELTHVGGNITFTGNSQLSTESIEALIDRLRAEGGFDGTAAVADNGDTLAP